MNKREKIYIIVAIILFSFLLVKSFYLDEYKPLTEDEKLFKEYVETVVYDSSFLNRNKLASFKVVSIEKLDNEGMSIIEVKSGNDNGYEKVEIKGKYKAKVRKYLFHFIPYGEDKILSRE